MDNENGTSESEQIACEAVRDFLANPPGQHPERKLRMAIEVSDEEIKELMRKR